MIKEKLKDNKEIGIFVDKFFEDNQSGLVFKAFEQLLFNLSSDLYFLVFSCLSECIPCYRNFLRAKANYYAVFAKKFDDRSDADREHQKIAYFLLSKSKDRYEIEHLNVSIKEKTFAPITVAKKVNMRKQSEANIVDFAYLDKLEVEKNQKSSRFRKEKSNYEFN